MLEVDREGEGMSRLVGFARLWENQRPCEPMPLYMRGGEAGMKRNKPIMKQRKSGTQYKRRRDAGYYGWKDYERGNGEWSIVVEQSVAGDARTFSTDGGVCAGEDGNPDDPRWKGIFRWKVDRDGKTFFFYSDRPEGSTDSFVVFTSERKCARGDSCPMVRYWCTDIDYSLSLHRPGSCPMAVLEPGAWKLQGPWVDRNKGW